MTTTSISLRSGNRSVFVLTSVSFKCSFGSGSMLLRRWYLEFYSIHIILVLTSLRLHVDMTSVALLSSFGFTSVSLGCHFDFISNYWGKMIAVWNPCRNYSDITVVPNGLRQMMGFPLPPKNSLHPALVQAASTNKHCSTTIVHREVARIIIMFSLWNMRASARWSHTQFDLFFT